jgi:hypothetical protein
MEFSVYTITKKNLNSELEITSEKSWKKTLFPRLLSSEKSARCFSARKKTEAFHAHTLKAHHQPILLYIEAQNEFVIYVQNEKATLLM